ncbi:MAG: ATP synthase subunit I [Pseudomonadota bacterium]
MIVVNWAALGAGGAIGLVMGAFFFAGLAFAMRHALRCENPIPLLTLSAAMRIAALLGVGWIVLAQGGPLAELGYATAFLVSRFIATTFARAGIPKAGAS